MDPLRIAMIGAGWVTQHHLDGYAAIAERAVVVAIADPDTDARRARQDAYGIDRSFDSAEDMLSELAGEVDAVDVASPRELHVEHVRLAVAHGLPVLCQKPLAPTFDEAKALLSALPGDARLMVHENWRFRPHYRLIRDWLDQERIGPLRQTILRMLTGGLIPSQDGGLPALVRQPMLESLERMLLMEVLIHHVDALRFLLGPLDLIAAEIGQDCQALAGEDRAMLMLRSAAPRFAPLSIIGDFMAHGHETAQIDRLEIFGRDGAIVLDESGLRQVRGTETVEHVEIDFASNYKASYRNAIAQFCDRVASGKAFETSPEDNLETLSLIEQAYGLAGSRAPSRSG